MVRNRIVLFVSLIVIIIAGIFFIAGNKADIPESNKKVISYVVDAKSQDIHFYWKNDSGKIIRSIQGLKTFVESKSYKLLFAMNGGMYNRDNSPQGLFIYRNQTLVPLDTASGEGNFYLKPNGVFYITSDNTPVISSTDNFKFDKGIKYATQSGPMLLIDGHIHPAFKQGSANLHIRNGVGILPDNRVVFAMSRIKVNFYDFASFFKDLGCKNALYLDGYVSRTYLPEKNWIQTDGNFGVIIGVTTSLKK